jgi:hypothetical protein
VRWSRARTCATASGRGLCCQLAAPSKYLSRSCQLQAGADNYPPPRPFLFSSPIQRYGGHVKQVLGKPVQQVCIKTGVVVATHPSQKDAAKHLGGNQSAISGVCRGVQAETSGYFWRFAGSNRAFPGYDRFKPKGQGRWPRDGTTDSPGNEKKRSKEKRADHANTTNQPNDGNDLCPAADTKDAVPSTTSRVSKELQVLLKMERMHQNFERNRKRESSTHSSYISTGVDYSAVTNRHKTNAAGINGGRTSVSHTSASNKYVSTGRPVGRPPKGGYKTPVIAFKSQLLVSSGSGYKPMNPLDQPRPVGRSASRFSADISISFTLEVMYGVRSSNASNYRSSHMHVQSLLSGCY